MKIQWMDQEYTSAPEYYRKVVLSMPRTDGVVLGAEGHFEALAQLIPFGRCALYIIDADASDIYVDSWRVNGSFLTHKHPEFGRIQTEWTEGLAECGLRGRVCGLCDKEISGEIQMIHYFYKLDG